MAKGNVNVIVICQSGGKFNTAGDGSLTYTGGDAHAISVSYDSKFAELKAEMAEMWKYDPASIVLKYFLPNNRRTLITISSDKDIKRMLDFHGDSATVDVYVMTIENQANDVSAMPCSRSSRTTEHEVENVTPLNIARAVAEDAEYHNNMADFDHEFGDFEQPGAIVMGYELPQRVKLWENCITGLHQQFDNVRELRDALRKYCIAHGFSLKFKKNDNTRVTAKCKVQGCPWRIHASRLSNTQLFRIKKLTDRHTCGGGSNATNRPQASKKVVADIVKDKLRSTPSVRPKELANQIRQEFGIEMGYSQARRWMDAARVELQGSYKEAYNQLPWLCEKIMETNPGSVVNLNTRDDSSFHRLFAAFHASIQGFQNGCRPLLFLDTMSLESKYQSELLTATAVDGNCGFFPIAFAVVDVVDDDNWHWFLVELKTALSTLLPITFVTDRQIGLKRSISVVFENSYHAYCLRHISEDLKSNLKGPCTKDVASAIVGHLYDAAYAATQEGFRRSMDSIKSISPEAHDWLLQSEPDHWANSLFLGARYNHVTSGIAESFYSQITEVSVLPVVQIIDTIRHKTMELIYTRKVDSDQWLTRLTPSVEDKLQKEILKAQSLRVIQSHFDHFEVQDFLGATCTVNIDAWDCTCRQWQLNGFPCSHAVAVLQYVGKDVYNYCSKYFTVEAFRLTYSETIKPVPTVDKPVAGEAEVMVLPPPLRYLSGSPKKRRIRSKGVIKRPLHCSNCKGAGHNRVSCPVVAA